MHAGAMSVYLNDDMLAGVVNSLLSRLKKGGLKSEVARTYLQAVGQIRQVSQTRQAGQMVRSIVYMCAHEHRHQYWAAGNR